jgi:hypothetical protein
VGDTNPPSGGLEKFAGRHDRYALKARPPTRRRPWRAIPVPTRSPPHPCGRPGPNGSSVAWIGTLLVPYCSVPCGHLIGSQVAARLQRPLAINPNAKRCLSRAVCSSAPSFRDDTTGLRAAGGSVDGPHLSRSQWAARFAKRSPNIEASGRVCTGRCHGTAYRGGGTCIVEI